MKKPVLPDEQEFQCVMQTEQEILAEYRHKMERLYYHEQYIPVSFITEYNRYYCDALAWVLGRDVCKDHNIMREAKGQADGSTNNSDV